jgi:Calcineurin-like phosphoesterase
MPYQGEPSQFFTRYRYPLLAFGGIILLFLACLYIFVSEDLDFARPSASQRCAMAHKLSKPLRFVAFGDWGSGMPFQKKLAQQLAITYQQIPFAEVFLLGDNIYETGDVQHLAKSYFEEPYAPLIKGGVRFRAALGNHDIRDHHMRAQIDYFKMPSDYYRISYGSADFFVLNTNSFYRNKRQQAWLAKNLQESRATWKIVLGHHPLYSSGLHGQTESLRWVLEPLLTRYHADFYLAGHDHDYERFKPIHGVQHIVSGGGGAFLSPFRKTPDPHSLVRLRTHHFLLFEMQERQLRLKVINRFGDLIDCAYWEKPLLPVKMPNKKVLKPSA